MRALLVSFLLGLAACAGNSIDHGSGAGNDGPPMGGGGDDDDGGVDSCANQGEADVFPSGLRAYDIAVSGSTLIASASPPASTASNSKIYACALNDCEPAVIGTPNRAATDVDVEADGANVYWTEHVPNGALPTDRLVRATVTGANRATLLEYNANGYLNPITPVVAADNRVSFYAAGRGANNLGELRTASSGAATTSLLGSMTTNVPVMATADGYTAVWTDGAGTVDRRIRGLDATGAEVVASPPLQGVQHVATDGAAVMYSLVQNNTESLFACLATDCAQPVDLRAAYGAVSSRFALANGRAYFVNKLAECSGKYALVSCELPDLLDGSCSPQVHAVGDLELINMRSLVVTADAAVFSSKLDGRVIRVDL